MSTGDGPSTIQKHSRSSLALNHVLSRVPVPVPTRTEHVPNSAYYKTLGNAGAVWLLGFTPGHLPLPWDPQRQPHSMAAPWPCQPCQLPRHLLAPVDYQGLSAQRSSLRFVSLLALRRRFRYCIHIKQYTQK